MVDLPIAELSSSELHPHFRGQTTWTYLDLVSEKNSLAKGLLNGTLRDTQGTRLLSAASKL